MKLFKKNENKKTTKLPMTGKVKKSLRNLFVVHYRKERMERDTGQLQFQHWVIKM